jgi:glutaredoxin-related protein
MDLSDPTADDLLVLSAAQRNRLKVLNVLPAGTDDDFEQVLLAYHRWDASRQVWVVGVDVLTELAFDARTPDGFARLLQQMVSWAKANDQTCIHPDSNWL